MSRNKYVTKNTEDYKIRAIAGGISAAVLIVINLFGSREIYHQYTVLLPAVLGGIIGLISYALSGKLGKIPGYICLGSAAIALYTSGNIISAIVSLFIFVLAATAVENTLRYTAASDSISELNNQTRNQTHGRRNNRRRKNQTY